MKMLSVKFHNNMEPSKPPHKEANLYKGGVDDAE